MRQGAGRFAAGRAGFPAGPLVPAGGDAYNKSIPTESGMGGWQMGPMQ